MEAMARTGTEESDCLRVSKAVTAGEWGAWASSLVVQVGSSWPADPGEAGANDRFHGGGRREPDYRQRPRQQRLLGRRPAAPSSSRHLITSRPPSRVVDTYSTYRITVLEYSLSVCPAVLKRCYMSQ